MKTRQRDTVRIGPGEFVSESVSAAKEIDIVGAGRDATKIVADPTVSELLSLQASADSSVSSLELRLTKVNAVALRLGDGADASDLAIRADHALTSETGDTRRRPWHRGEPARHSPRPRPANRGDKRDRPGDHSPTHTSQAGIGLGGRRRTDHCQAPPHQGRDRALPVRWNPDREGLGDRGEPREHVLQWRRASIRATARPRRRADLSR